MTVATAPGIVRLSGRCMAEDAELLLEQLTAGVTQVDLTDCDYLHGALVQLLMAARPSLVGEPAEFLRDWVIPLIRRQDSP